jgi:hypothetical protein
VHIQEFVQQVIDDVIPDSAAAITYYKERGYTIIAAEVTDAAIDLHVRSEEYYARKKISSTSVAVIV